MYKDDHRTVIQNSDKNQSNFLFCTAAITFSSKCVISILKFATFSEIDCIQNCRDKYQAWANELQFELHLCIRRDLDQS